MMISYTDTMEGRTALTQHRRVSSSQSGDGLESISLNCNLIGYETIYDIS